MARELDAGGMDDNGYNVEFIGPNGPDDFYDEEWVEVRIKNFRNEGWNPLQR